MVKVFVYATLESIWIIVLAFTGSRLVYILNIIFLYLHIYLYRCLPSIRVKKCILKCLFCLTKCEPTHLDLEIMCFLALHFHAINLLNMFKLNSWGLHL